MATEAQYGVMVVVVVVEAVVVVVVSEARAVRGYGAMGGEERVGYARDRVL